MLRSIVITLVLILTVSQNSCEPFGLRIYYGDIVTNLSSLEKLVIYFNTKGLCNDSFLSLSSDNILRNISCLTKSIVASSYMNYYVAHIHVCSVADLSFQQYFSYTAYGWNATVETNPTPFKETSITIKLIDPTVATRSLKMVVLADWGRIQSNIMTPITDYLKTFINSTEVNAVMIVGDISYALDSYNGTNYEDFLNLMQEYSTKLPFFLTPGNHERRTVDAALLFNETFKVYGIDKKLATGIYFGSVFLTIFDPFNYVYGRPQTVSCLDALKIELSKGLQSGRFIIPYSHYALICSAQYSQCAYNYNRLKIYIDPMLDSGVRLYVGAHTHSYERTFPLYRNGTFINKEPPYAPEEHIISIVEGVSGNNKSIMTSMPALQSFTSNYTVNQTGFGVISSNTHYVTYEHFSTKQGFMDKLIINLPQKDKEKARNYVGLAIVISILVIALASTTMLIVKWVLRPSAKVQIKREKADITQTKDSINDIVEQPKIQIQLK